MGIERKGKMEEVRGRERARRTEERLKGRQGCKKDEYRGVKEGRQAGNAGKKGGGKGGNEAVRLRKTEGGGGGREGRKLRP